MGGILCQEVMEQALKVEALEQEGDLGVELETHRVAWELALLVEWDEEEVEEVEVVEVWGPVAIVYAQLAEQEYLIRQVVLVTR